MRAPNKVEPDVALPRDAWLGVLTETMGEVFSIMVGAGITMLERADLPVRAQMTGMVGIAGAIRANFVLQCSSSAAIKVASQMLGVAADDPDSEKAACDAVGEICNIVAGYFKAKIGYGDSCMLSVPTIIVGQDYRFHSEHVFDRLELRFVYEEETLGAALEIAR